MLEVFFANVGDGDAVLIREHRKGLPDYTVLVDAGRPYLEPKQDSLRKEAIYYLKARGVERIDRMVLSHLHIDHIGGALRILNMLPVDRICALRFPPADADWIMPPFDSMDKATNGLVQLLNIFRDITEEAKRRGTMLEPVRAGITALTNRLSVTAILPKQAVIERQAHVFDALYRNEPVDADEWYRASKERNVSSVMFRFTYAGRSILLTGDRYAADFEDELIEPCDVLKLPHHGDPKSMTVQLLQKLAPSIAVISCQSDAAVWKDRPNAGIVALLQNSVSQVFCTENKALPTLPAATHNGIRVTISDDGAMTCETE
jgi:beta-lactamase superfamily II metal-dependent hydrolase